ncbi:unnamed protein product [Brassicogethes aeneus]|uniref:Uncharacterized protein n=1 Tax=Brassicogethes aeneus TaxID=1431903 RepID=A0A9P0B7K7_BRAAE|nr:unnamed protein product [Brassicogethes aeneus]
MVNVKDETTAEMAESKESKEPKPPQTAKSNNNQSNGSTAAPSQSAAIPQTTPTTNHVPRKNRAHSYPHLHHPGAFHTHYYHHQCAYMGADLLDGATSPVKFYFGPGFEPQNQPSPAQAPGNEHVVLFHVNPGVTINLQIGENVEHINFGFRASKLLNEVKVPEKEKLLFLQECQKFLIESVSKLLERCGLNHRMVKGLSCLDPNIISSNHSLIAQRTIFDNIVLCRGAENIIGTEDMIKHYKQANKKYKEYLEKQKTEREKNARQGEKRKIEMEIKELNFKNLN